MSKIMFTGGGSAGHVSVNLALIPLFLKEKWIVAYIGSEHGIERELVTPIKEVTYYGIATGKLRRYMDWRNVKDPFKVIKGTMQAYWLIRKQRPSIVFSKGGFVSVPVVVAAWLNKVPVIIHESDITPGLANRMAIPFAAAVCTTFPETAAALKHRKTYPIGAIIRDELKQGDRNKGRSFAQLNGTKPVLMIMGGSLGSKNINHTIRQILPLLLADFQIIHLCGKGQLDASKTNPGYRQYEFIKQELPDLLAMTDIVISRAGSNSIFEFLYLRIPMLLIPLTKAQSRGDQIQNAQSFEAAGYCEVLQEERLSEQTLLSGIKNAFDNRHILKGKMEQSPHRDALLEAFQLIKKAAKKA